MKKLTFLLMIAALTITTGTAFGQSAQTDDWLDKNMGFGIGASRGVNGAMGLGLRLFPTETFGFGLVLGGNIERRTTTTPPQSVTIPEAKTFTRDSRFDVSLFGDFRFLRSNRSALSVYTGIGISSVGKAQTFASQAIPGQFVTGSDSIIDLGIEFGLRGELFLYQFFSVHGRVGINVNPITDNETPNVVDPQTPQVADPLAPSNGGAVVRIFDNGDFFGGFGFTLWFN